MIGFDGQMMKMGDPIQVTWEETTAPVVPTQVFDHQIYQGAPKGFASASVVNMNRQSLA